MVHSQREFGAQGMKLNMNAEKVKGEEVLQFFTKPNSGLNQGTVVQLNTHRLSIHIATFN